MARITIDIRKGDVTRAKAAAIVNPTNVMGAMRAGVGLAIRRAGGGEVQAEVLEQAPIPVGMAVATAAGHLPFRYVIHASIMRRARQRIPHENVAAATRAALELADRLGCSSLAMPGIGTHTGKVPRGAAAREMLGAIGSYRPARLRHILLVDDNRMVNAWRNARNANGDADNRNEEGHRKPRPRRRRHPSSRR